MKKNVGSLVLFIFALITVFLQISFIMADFRSTPSKTSIDFAKAYYLKSPEMNKFLANNLNEQKMAEKYIKDNISESSKIGFESNYLRERLFHISTKTTYLSKSVATVELTAKSKKYINPLYNWISNIFYIGKIDTIDEVFTLIKEDKEWKISKNYFDNVLNE